MKIPAVEIKLEPIAGRGLTDVALSMTNIARALSITVVCEFQPGVILSAAPSTPLAEVLAQYPGYEKEAPAPPALAVARDPRDCSVSFRPDSIMLDGDRMRALSTRLHKIEIAAADIRSLFQEWGGR